MCGDPGCPSCGTPGWAEAEAAEVAILDEMAGVKCSPIEMRFVLAVGLHALTQVRKLIAEQNQNRELSDSDLTTDPE